MNAREVIHACRLLAEYSEQSGVTTRTFLSPPVHDVHARVREWMERSGMSVRVDAAGNIRGTYPATSPAAPVLVIGSHLDTVPQAGAFDGVLGVVVGIALVEQLAGARLPFAIEVVGFSDEEGVRFGVPFIGSRAMTGTLDDALLARHDARGRSMADVIRDFGLDPARLDEARAPANALGYVEFHIEQGPMLDDLRLPLAVVDAIAGQTRLDVVFVGEGNHAGTTPMSARRDALAGAAEWICAVEQEARATTGLVATCGRIEAIPGAANVVPGRCQLSLDVRHAEDRVRAAAVRKLLDQARQIAGVRGLTVHDETRLDQAATPMDPSLTSALVRAVERSGCRPHRMASGAGHDAMVVARRLPAAMLFIRSPRGISHHPDESVEEDDVAAALAAGRCFLDELARTRHG